MQGSRNEIYEQRKRCHRDIEGSRNHDLGSHTPQQSGPVPSGPSALPHPTSAAARPTSTAFHPPPIVRRVVPRTGAGPRFAHSR
jgi:hypothetical protein